MPRVIPDPGSRRSLARKAPVSIICSGPFPGHGCVVEGLEARETGSSGKDPAGPGHHGADALARTGCGPEGAPGASNPV